MNHISILKYLVFFFIGVVTIILFLASYLFFIVPMEFNASSLKSLKNIIQTSDTKFSQELWLNNGVNCPRLVLYNDLSNNYLAKNFKYNKVENLLGKPDYYRVYDDWFYKRTCKQYFLGQESSFGSVSIYMVICPDEKDYYVEDVYTISHKSFTQTFDLGKEVTP
jgi:hypothetical protein